MATALFIALLFHFIGDYLLQNDWMALNKTKSSIAAFIHAFCYSLLFMTLLDWKLWIIVAGTHFLIDRFRLAVYWIRLVNWNWKGNNFGYGDEKPMFMSIWLMIIIDNTFHVLINSLCVIVQYF
jgi:hypothetical protein